jgi:cell division protein FtsQ
LSAVKLDIKKILMAIVWFTIGVCGMLLLVAAVKNKGVKTCKEVSIEISGVSNNFFIDKADVLAIIKNYVGAHPKGKAIGSFNLAAIETNLEKDVWIKNAELFFDNNEVLRVSIDEREPVARVFAQGGGSFYIDSSLKVLPLSEKFSARLPVFTGFSNNPTFLSKADSSMLVSIKEISMALQADSFLMAMIEQVDITPQRNFEMIPKIGSQLIFFGSAADVEEKFKKLRLFYKTVIPKAGWSKYSVINLEFKNQVVAKIKDAADKTTDSLRTLQIMQFVAERAARQAADSALLFASSSARINTDSSMIQQSVQREEEGDDAITNVVTEKPVVATPLVPVKTVPIVKPVIKKVVPAKKAIPKKAAGTTPVLKKNQPAPKATMKPGQ